MQDDTLRAQVPIANTLGFLTSHPLTRGNKIAAFIRFLRWQLVCHIRKGDIVHDWISGTQFFVRKGETGLTGNIYAGLHEFHDMAFLLHAIRPNDVFIDVGANVGSYTLLACAAGQATGYCFEPVPSTFHRLMQNIRLNKLENRVKAHMMALGEHAGSLKFTDGVDTINHVVTAGESCENPIQVEVSTLDSAIKGVSPAILKVDVEGFETPVLLGATETLKNSTLFAVIMELNGSGSRYGYDESRIMQLMNEHGFKSYTYDPFERRLISIEGKNTLSGNTLFIRDECKVRDRLVSAATISIFGERF